MGYWNHAGEYVSELLGPTCEDAYFYDTPRRSRRLAVPSLVDFLRELLKIGTKMTLQLGSSLESLSARRTEQDR